MFGVPGSNRSGRKDGTSSVWETLQLDALAFTGHKGLRGPQGTGGFLIRNELASQIEPLLSAEVSQRFHQPSNNEL